MALATLAPELICLIAGYVHPSSLLDFCQSCGHVAACLEPFLEKCRNADREGRHQQDREPLTVLNLLRSVAEDRPNAWALRRLELWGMRKQWSEWENIPIVRSFYENPGGDDNHVDSADLNDSILTPRELALYRKIVRDELRMPASNADEWVDMIRQGNDEPLRAVLIATAHRLSEIAFLDSNRRRPLRLLGDVLRSLHRSGVPHGAWPLGFQSLTSIAVNPKSNCDLTDDVFYGKYDIAPLFLLPNLKHIALVWVRSDPPDDYPNTWNVPPRSSSVETLTFDTGDFSFDHEDVLEIIRSIKALKILRLGRRNYDDVGWMPEAPRRRRELVKALIEHHSETLEAVVVCSSEGSDHCIDFDLAAQLQSLRYIQLRMSDISVPSGDSNWFGFPLDSALPSTIEYLSITGVDLEHKDLPLVMNDLYRLAQLRGFSAGESRGPLKDICLQAYGFVEIDSPKYRLLYDYGWNNSRFYLGIEIRKRYYKKLWKQFKSVWVPLFADLGVRLHTGRVFKVSDFWSVKDRLDLDLEPRPVPKGLEAEENSKIETLSKSLYSRPKWMVPAALRSVTF